MAYRRNAVVHMVAALRYKPEGWGQLEFIDLNLPALHYGPGVDHRL